MIRVSVQGTLDGPRIVTLPAVPVEGNMIRLDRHPYTIAVVEWVPDADHVNIYVQG